MSVLNLSTMAMSTCEWEWDAGTELDKLMMVLWPYISENLKSILENDVNKSLRSLSKGLKKLHFENVSLGTIAPHVYKFSVKICRDAAGRAFIKCKSKVSYEGDLNISLKLGNFPGSAGVKSMTVKCEPCIFIGPFLSQLPLVGGIQVTCHEPPTLDVDFTGLTNLIDLPIIDRAFRNELDSQIAQLIVFPNKVVIPLAHETCTVHKPLKDYTPAKTSSPTLSFSNPLPEGLIRLNVKGLLMEKPRFSFVEVELCSGAVERSLIPITNEHGQHDPLFSLWCEFLVHDFSEQKIKVRIFDCGDYVAKVVKAKGKDSVLSLLPAVDSELTDTMSDEEIDEGVDNLRQDLKKLPDCITISNADAVQEEKDQPSSNEDVGKVSLKRAKGKHFAGLSECGAPNSTKQPSTVRGDVKPLPLKPSPPSSMFSSVAVDAPSKKSIDEKSQLSSLGTKEKDNGVVNEKENIQSTHLPHLYSTSSDVATISEDDNAVETNGNTNSSSENEAKIMIKSPPNGTVIDKNRSAEYNVGSGDGGAVGTLHNGVEKEHFTYYMRSPAHRDHKNNALCSLVFEESFHLQALLDQQDVADRLHANAKCIAMCCRFDQNQSNTQPRQQHQLSYKESSQHDKATKSDSHSGSLFEHLTAPYSSSMHVKTLNEKNHTQSQSQSRSPSQQNFHITTTASNNNNNNNNNNNSNTLSASANRLSQPVPRTSLNLLAVPHKNVTTDASPLLVSPSLSGKASALLGQGLLSNTILDKLKKASAHSTTALPAASPISCFVVQMCGDGSGNDYNTRHLSAIKVNGSEIDERSFTTLPIEKNQKQVKSSSSKYKQQLQEEQNNQELLQKDEDKLTKQNNADETEEEYENSGVPLSKQVQVAVISPETNAVCNFKSFLLSKDKHWFLQLFSGTDHDLEHTLKEFDHFLNVEVPKGFVVVVYVPPKAVTDWKGFSEHLRCHLNVKTNFHGQSVAHDEPYVVVAVKDSYKDKDIHSDDATTVSIPSSVTPGPTSNGVELSTSNSDPSDNHNTTPHDPMNLTLPAVVSQRASSIGGSTTNDVHESSPTVCSVDPLVFAAKGILVKGFKVRLAYCQGQIFELPFLDKENDGKPLFKVRLSSCKKEPSATLFVGASFHGLQKQTTLIEATSTLDKSKSDDQKITHNNGNNSSTNDSDVVEDEHSESSVVSSKKAETLLKLFSAVGGVEDGRRFAHDVSYMQSLTHNLQMIFVYPNPKGCSFSFGSFANTHRPSIKDRQMVNCTSSNGINGAPHGRKLFCFGAADWRSSPTFKFYSKLRLLIRHIRSDSKRDQLVGLFIEAPWNLPKALEQILRRTRPEMVVISKTEEKNQHSLSSLQSMDSNTESVNSEEKLDETTLDDVVNSENIIPTTNDDAHISTTEWRYGDSGLDAKLTKLRFLINEKHFSIEEASQVLDLSETEAQQMLDGRHAYVMEHARPTFNASGSVILHDHAKEFLMFELVDVDSLPADFELLLRQYKMMRMRKGVGGNPVNQLVNFVSQKMSQMLSPPPQKNNNIINIANKNKIPPPCDASLGVAYIDLHQKNNVSDDNADMVEVNFINQRTNEPVGTLCLRTDVLNIDV